MEQSIFGFIWRYSKLQQVVILVVTVLSFPFLYAALELPKIIINDAIDGKGFPVTYFGHTFEQIPFLLGLCTALLTLVVINGMFKMKVNVFKGALAERLLRRLRYQLYERILRFPIPRFQTTSQGELVSMVTAEGESLGSYFGDSIAKPAFQGGTMLTILVFLFVQDPTLGLASVALIPVQAWLIPKLQFQINMLNKARVQEVRRLSESISESVSGIQDIHANDTSAFKLSGVSWRLGRIFKIRFQIYKKKFFMKFLNNFINQMTPLMFYSIGGILAIKGDITIGALVAALAAYKDLMAPWKELLKYYQDMANSKIKYQQLLEQFDPAGMLDESLQRPRPEELPKLGATLELENVVLQEEDGFRVLDGVSFSADAGKNLAIVGTGAGRDRLAQALVRLAQPTGGRIMIGGLNLAGLHEAVIGSRIGYVGPESYIFNGSIAHNILYGLKHAAIGQPSGDGDDLMDRTEAVASGNSADDPSADWINPKILGMESSEELTQWWMKIIRRLGIEDLLFTRALNMQIDPAEFPGLAESILNARHVIEERLEESPDVKDLVHFFDYDSYNVNASVGSNVIFGEPTDQAFALNSLGENDYVSRVLEESGLTERFQEIGLQVARTLVDLFSDMELGHPIFEQYSFVGLDDLENLKPLLERAERCALSELPADDQKELISLTFQLIVERHRLGFITEEIQQKLVKVREKFRENLPQKFDSAIAFFDRETFNPQLSLQCNLLMGRINLARPRAEERICKLVCGVLDEQGLREQVIMAATTMSVGIGGKRLPLAMRQLIALARSIVKKPEILIVNDALNAHARESADEIRRAVFDLLPETTLIWMASETPNIAEFDQVLVLRQGRIVERLIEQVSGEQQAVALDESEEAATPEEGPTILDAETEALAEVPLFSAMDRTQLKLLAFSAQRVTFVPGEEVFHQGAQAFAAYVVLEGQSEVVVGKGENETVINRPKENEIIGEMSLLTDNPRSASFRAVGELTVLRIKKDVFLNLVEHDPHLALELSRAMSDRMAQMMHKIEEAA
ncbi:MAG: cyclic nucleotide-binding domain-containing protein [Rhodospirillaceae bacterium]|jgi:ABC-type multidrug transport system fused ATPase/permease subunit|nr:cyclic nucleotide-binding domain-containing protein [Rhodospirillaceae bacterium]MBT7771310.1 cyclic nucleotide-binding domain-containing protein [Rhodospirillales bacterium]MBT4700488.1 cyclic nucleotide-binding domain-containing protein [Rhodospirillaceae bacterium]MBT5033456.1 cyclic nucleotide-binding domain-containing protein [Rhodospirillaceae bacterium]MBT6221350.1 cyclic nucleotide-binding domain-containing protein [Rhodospirillaceae bacterium]